MWTTTVSRVTEPMSNSQLLRQVDDLKMLAIMAILIACAALIWVFVQAVKKSSTPDPTTKPPNPHTQAYDDYLAGEWWKPHPGYDGTKEPDDV